MSAGDPNKFMEQNPYWGIFEWHPMNEALINRVKCLDCGKPTKPYRGKELCKRCRINRDLAYRNLIKKRVG